jgi:enoyl-CoA hydratase
MATQDAERGGSDEFVSRHFDDGRLTLTLNRPEQRNALSGALFAELRHGLAEARSDRNVRVVVLAGAGDCFCAGGDLREMAQLTDPFDAHYARAQLALVMRDLWELGKPTIARVHGLALAGGFGLAVSCDLVLASERAQFGVPEVTVGLWPYMITVPLLYSMRPKDALRLMMTGERVSAAEGFALGFVTAVTAPDDLDAAVANWSARLQQGSPTALALGRSAFYSVLNNDVDSRLRMLEAALSVNIAFPEAKEGMAAFAERRPPEWLNA